MVYAGLRQVMDGLGVTAQDAASAIGRSAASVYAYRSGSKVPAADAAAALCRYLRSRNETMDPSPYRPSDLTVEALFGGTR